MIDRLEPPASSYYIVRQFAHKMAVQAYVQGSCFEYQHWTANETVRVKFNSLISFVFPKVCCYIPSMTHVSSDPLFPVFAFVLNHYFYHSILHVVSATMCYVPNAMKKLSNS